MRIYLNQGHEWWKNEVKNEKTHIEEGKMKIRNGKHRNILEEQEKNI